MEAESNNKKLDQLIDALRNQQPALTNPENLTENIMNAIQDLPADRNIFLDSGNISILKKLLAAASICLFLIFSYEQYVVVDKIGRLERQNANIAHNKKYQTAIKLNEAITMLKSDPDYLRQYEKIQNNPAGRSKLVRAAMFYDLLMLKNKESHNEFIKK